ncbi:TlpA family protein disulfide reductase [Gaetbulibacter aestuarii]|uniref:Thioredoxin family protein n=1 Tax=Gaetbulibacter aestuarii TaxID=1502358 RepID=A0ABW7N278_9FLAO
MKTYTFLLVSLMGFLSCKSAPDPTQFSEAALNDTFISLDGSSVPFKDILKKHQGETLFIEVWASWCGDCLKGMPTVKEIQSQYPDVTYVFLSLDRNQEAWKKGIKKYQVNGEHYFMQSGWKGPFGAFLDLDWIPRYIVVDKSGTISLYNAEKATDNRITQNL